MIITDPYLIKHNIIKAQYVHNDTKIVNVIIEFSNGDVLNYTVTKNAKTEHITHPKIFKEKVLEYERRKKIMKITEKL